MSTTFVVSDTHFSQQSICEFENPNGTKMRPLWTNAAHMDEDMVRWWNEIVQPTDKVYHLGDVAMNKRGLAVIDRCNGRKVLIKGNHDREKLNQYTGRFYDVRAGHLLSGILLTHIPVHPNQLDRFTANVHGHMHCNKINDPRYLNVCVEHTNWRPIAWDTIEQQVKASIRDAADRV